MREITHNEPSCLRVIVAAQLIDNRTTMNSKEAITAKKVDQLY